uniref:Uncharacterized protein n=1 Tax=Picea sitchensis TaxID=3332 RepID=D5A8C0_PICSI|nr:unknown [Picea sitchensis]
MCEPFIFWVFGLCLDRGSFFGLCLDKGSFDIYGTTETKIEMLKWNCNSVLLAALVRYEE